MWNHLFGRRPASPVQYAEPTTKVSADPADFAKQIVGKFHDLMMTASEDGICCHDVYADFVGATLVDPGNPDITIYVKCHGLGGVSGIEVAKLVNRHLADLDYQPVLTEGDAANLYGHKVRVPDVFPGPTR
jgi:hypothetical protein